MTIKLVETLSCDFSKYSSIKEAYWKYSDGTYRLGWFSVNEGFSGEVKTFYKNQISEYVVTGMFVKTSLMESRFFTPSRIKDTFDWRI